MRRGDTASTAVPITLLRQDEGRLLTLTIEHREAAEGWVLVGDDTWLGIASGGLVVALTVSGATGDDALVALLRAFEDHGGALTSSFEHLLDHAQSRAPA